MASAMSGGRSRPASVTAVRRPYTGKPEDHLDVERVAAEGVGEIKSPDVHGRDQGVAQHVAPEHRSFGQPLGASGPHPVLVHRFEQGRSHDLNVGAGQGQRGRDPGQQQVPEPLKRVLGQGHVLPIGEDLPLVGKEAPQQRGEHERWHRVGRRGGSRDQPVRPSSPVADTDEGERNSQSDGDQRGAHDKRSAARSAPRREAGP